MIQSVTMTVVVFSQTLYYQRESGQRISDFNRVVISTYLVILGANLYALMVLQTESLYAFIHVLGLFKLYVSVAKYIPQVRSFTPVRTLQYIERP